MEDSWLGRVVLDRWRHARLFGLGDRTSPSSYTPGLVLCESDSEINVEFAPFRVTKTPSGWKFEGRGKLEFPFENEGPNWELPKLFEHPPALADVKSNRTLPITAVKPITWQQIRQGALSEENDDNPPQVVVLVDAVQLTQNTKRFVEAVHAIRVHWPQALLWAIGISGPDNLALLTWMGCDLHDLSRSRMTDSAGLLLEQTGVRKHNANLESPPNMTTQVEEWKRALATVRTAIGEGNLRGLVEMQSLASPKMVEQLRYHDAIVAGSPQPPLASSVPSLTKFRAHSPQSARDPLVKDWIRRIKEDYTPPNQQQELLVLLPCSAKKPYRISKSHRTMTRNIPVNAAHQMIVTSPLGLVPRELEQLWPASHYDVPVTGEWSMEEIATISQMTRALVERIGYRSVVNHSGLDIGELGIPVIDTRQGEGATSNAALTRLSKAVTDAAESLQIGKVKRGHLHIEEFKSVSRWLHGGDEWLEGARVGGKPPRWLLLDGKVQLAQWNDESRTFSFSKASLPRLREHGILTEVKISPNFKWNGDLFSELILSTPIDIRKGDEILVTQSDKLIGSAKAVAPSWEWKGVPGRLAKGRHRI